MYRHFRCICTCVMFEPTTLRLGTVGMQIGLQGDVITTSRNETRNSKVLHAGQTKCTFQLLFSQFPNTSILCHCLMEGGKTKYIYIIYIYIYI